ncbi:enoyl-ACP reductase FabI [Aquisalimonas sp. 2447]|uniref:enoyl-ACP reductase FabI n=1 Tax=Aquisalimonas sp. 2447 TaxID=2740807 RepID=UPI0014323237|nr:enoyl-ACP reductase FabI [Aquisalimonas sp. 2447]QIT56764.1 enoyl-ACP reductase FabI [Aquisalimonas sp. 2447]
MSDFLSLKGKRGLVVGVANEDSIAWACARAFHELGAELAMTYVNDKALPWVRPLAERVHASLFMPCDVREPGQLESVFETIEAEWGQLDFLLHSIAFAPRDDLHARVVDSSQAGFLQAMDVSCHSFLRMAHMAEPLMPRGGALLTVSFYGAEKVVEDYNLMGPVKAALEASVRYAAAELGPQGIRVHALSPGPLKTRAASGIQRFDDLLERARQRAPQDNLADIDDVGAAAAFLVSDRARTITGNTTYIDAGYHVVG